MRIEALAPWVAVMLALFLLPRLARGPRGLGVVVGLGGLGLGAGWLGLGLVSGLVNLFVATAAVASAAVALGLGLAVRVFGLIARSRGWPGWIDAGVTLAGALSLSVGFLKVFDAL